jgi:hypothetical protein
VTTAAGTTAARTTAGGTTAGGTTAAGQGGDTSPDLAAAAAQTDPGRQTAAEVARTETRGALIVFWYL